MYFGDVSISEKTSEIVISLFTYFQISKNVMQDMRFCLKKNFGYAIFPDLRIHCLNFQHVSGMFEKL